MAIRCLLIDLALLSDRCFPADWVQQCASSQQLWPLLNWDKTGSLEFSTTFCKTEKTSFELWFWQGRQAHWLCWLILCDAINSSLSAWQQKFISVMEECIPHPTVTADSNSSTPWLSKSILWLIWKRNRLFKPRRKFPSTMMKYKRLRNCVVKLLQHAKKLCYHKFHSTSLNAKKLWKLSRSMTNSVSDINYSHSKAQWPNCKFKCRSSQSP